MDNNNDDMAAYFEQGMENLRARLEPGEKVTGTVTAITRNSVFLDIHAKSEGVIDRSELQQDGELTVAPGDEVEAYFKNTDDGEIILTTRLKGRGADALWLEQAFVSEIPVEGRVTTECKGGFEVDFGGHRGFCPFSQIDIFGSKHNDLYPGQLFTFLIVEYEDDNSFVVSRRQLLEAERDKAREAIRESLSEGDVVEGAITKVLDFGAFVDIGGGVEGLLPIGELSWGRVKQAEDVVAAGDKVSVRVAKIDWDKDRITLSLRLMHEDPWLSVEGKYHPTRRYVGVVAKLMDFGAFVSLEPGIDGLVHISKLGAGKRLAHASEVLEEGQQLEVVVESVDLERKRISLVLENTQIGRTLEVDGDSVRVGAEVEGTVEDVKEFGVFIRLSPQHTGLLHVSEIDFEGGGNKTKEMRDRFAPGSAVTVRVKGIEGKRVSLELPLEAGENMQDLLEDDKSGDLGSISSMFDGLEL